jgi:hypothetical protein
MDFIFNMPIIPNSLGKSAIPNSKNHEVFWADEAGESSSMKSSR